MDHFDDYPSIDADIYWLGITLYWGQPLARDPTTGERSITVGHYLYRDFLSRHPEFDPTDPQWPDQLPQSSPLLDEEYIALGFAMRHLRDPDVYWLGDTLYWGIEITRDPQTGERSAAHGRHLYLDFLASHPDYYSTGPEWPQPPPPTPGALSTQGYLFLHISELPQYIEYDEDLIIPEYPEHPDYPTTISIPPPPLSWEELLALYTPIAPTDRPLHFPLSVEEYLARYSPVGPSYEEFDEHGVTWLDRYELGDLASQYSEWEHDWDSDEEFIPQILDAAGLQHEAEIMSAEQAWEAQTSMDRADYVDTGYPWPDGSEYATPPYDFTAFEAYMAALPPQDWYHMPEEPDEGYVPEYDDWQPSAFWTEQWLEQYAAVDMEEDYPPGFWDPVPMAPRPVNFARHTEVLQLIGVRWGPAVIMTYLSIFEAAGQTVPDIPWLRRFRRLPRHTRPAVIPEVPLRRRHRHRSRPDMHLYYRRPALHCTETRRRGLSIPRCSHRPRRQQSVFRG